jgi:hypothetical protein
VVLVQLLQQVFFEPGPTQTARAAYGYCMHNCMRHTEEKPILTLQTLTYTNNFNITLRRMNHSFQRYI